jgi:hypothetical protein
MIERQPMKRVDGLTPAYQVVLDNSHARRFVARAAHRRYCLSSGPKPLIRSDNDRMTVLVLCAFYAVAHLPGVLMIALLAGLCGAAWTGRSVASLGLSGVLRIGLPCAGVVMLVYFASILLAGRRLPANNRGHDPF